jgi:anti-sigma regulatory factor (Ser/Thr protein kinase)
MEEPAKIKKPGCTEAIPAFVEFVTAFAQGTCLDEERIDLIGQAVRQTAENIVRWSYSTGEPGDIEISCTTDDNGNLWVTTVDWGAPFNMLLADAFPDTWDSDGGKEKPPVKIIKKAFNNLEYKRDLDRNILVFIFMLPLTPGI